MRCKFLRGVHAEFTGGRAGGLITYPKRVKLIQIIMEFIEMGAETSDAIAAGDPPQRSAADTSFAAGTPPVSIKGNSFGDMLLFWASFFTLIAAGMGFAIRGDILGDWGRQFHFTQTELGI